ncbi:hypothetical protein QE152_g25118 [Popillia japonica]|uniref:Uncharacterized protein n=1 Tax=Popillia japonica TaxID=7064 RepID=A0AAW1K387_POPJA
MYNIPEAVRSKVERDFTGADIRKLLTDTLFVESMNGKKKEAWVSFKDVVEKFLVNTKDPDYEKIVQWMLAAYEAQGCKMGLKVHFLLFNGC